MKEVPMGLGNRYAQMRRDVHHDTVALRSQAVNAELWHEFREGQRVQTVDGVPGVVAHVEDGPFPGSEQYVVELDRGLGGGAYTASQLTALGPTQASDIHTADLDYPELGTILHDRPDIAKSASKHTASEDDDKCELCGEEEGSDNWAGENGCPWCGSSVPAEVGVRGNHITIENKPWNPDGRGPEFHSHVSQIGDKSHAIFVKNEKEYSGVGDTHQESAENAYRDYVNKTQSSKWEPRPAKYFRKLDQER